MKISKSDSSPFSKQDLETIKLADHSFGDTRPLEPDFLKHLADVCEKSIADQNQANGTNHSTKVIHTFVNKYMPEFDMSLNFALGANKRKQTYHQFVNRDTGLIIKIAKKPNGNYITEFPPYFYGTNKKGDLDKIPTSYGTERIDTEVNAGIFYSAIRISIDFKNAVNKKADSEGVQTIDIGTSRGSQINKAVQYATKRPANQIIDKTPAYLSSTQLEESKNIRVRSADSNKESDEERAKIIKERSSQFRFRGEDSIVDHNKQNLNFIDPKDLTSKTFIVKTGGVIKHLPEPIHKVFSRFSATKQLGHKNVFSHFFFTEDLRKATKQTIKEIDEQEKKSYIKQKKQNPTFSGYEVTHGGAAVVPSSKYNDPGKVTGIFHSGKVILAESTSKNSNINDLGHVIGVTYGGNAIPLKKNSKFSNRSSSPIYAKSNQAITTRF